MAASDNLSVRLFHGTHAVLKPGDWLDPKYSEVVDEEDPNHHLVHATTDIIHALAHGSHVYEVNPSSKQMEWGNVDGHYVSEEGFQIKRKLPEDEIRAKIREAT